MHTDRAKDSSRMVAISSAWAAFSRSRGFFLVAVRVPTVLRNSPE